MTVEISVALFAGMRAAAGCDHVTISIPTTCDSAAILDAVAAALPATANLAQASRVAVDDRFLSGETTLSDASQLAIIPPVSGG